MPLRSPRHSSYRVVNPFSPRVTSPISIFPSILINHRVLPQYLSPHRASWATQVTVPLTFINLGIFRWIPRMSRWRRGILSVLRTLAVASTWYSFIYYSYFLSPRSRRNRSNSTESTTRKKKRVTSTLPTEVEVREGGNLVRIELKWEESDEEFMDRIAKESKAARVESRIRIKRRLDHTMAKIRANPPPGPQSHMERFEQYYGMFFFFSVS